MTQHIVEPIIDTQSEGMAGLIVHGMAGQDGAAGAAGASSVGVASDSAASNAAVLSLDTPVNLHLTVSGDAGEASLVIGSLDGQTVLVSNGVLSIGTGDGQAELASGLDEDLDHAAVDPLEPGFHELLAQQHEMRAQELEARLMQKFQDHSGWSVFG